MPRSVTSTLTLFMTAALGLAGCQDDPRYIPSANYIEWDGAVQDDMTPPPMASIDLPFELETEEDAAERAALAAMLGVEVPYVNVDDISVSIEWTLKNLSADPASARIKLGGANPYFSYVPALLVVDPEEDEEPPPLSGDVPIDVPADGVVSGVFREDQLREASIDLDQITRGNMNAFAAVLGVHEDLTEFQPMTFVDPEDPNAMSVPSGPPIPLAAIPLMVRFDLSLEVQGANAHMILEFAVRVRDHRGVVHNMLLSAPAGELTTYAPATYDPLAAL